MIGTAATPGALILLGGAALLYWALFTPNGILAKSKIPPVLPPNDFNGQIPGAPGSGGDVGTGSNLRPPKGYAAQRYIDKLPPLNVNTYGLTYEQQKQAFMDALDVWEGGPNSVNPKSGAYGQYQIMPRIWDAWSRHYFGRILPKTPANSKLLASRRIDDYYKSYVKRIGTGELSSDVSIWTRIAGAWSTGPSLGHRSDWRTWGRHSYVYSTNIIYSMQKIINNERN